MNDNNPRLGDNGAAPAAPKLEVPEWADKCFTPEQMRKPATVKMLCSYIGIIQEAMQKQAKRIADLEGRGTLRYLGTWSEKSGYGENVAITDGGSVWISKSATQPGERPGHSAAWQLAVKRGANGKDLRQ